MKDFNIPSEEKIEALAEAIENNREGLKKLGREELAKKRRNS